MSYNSVRIQILLDAIADPKTKASDIEDLENRVRLLQELDKD